MKVITSFFQQILIIPRCANSEKSDQRLKFKDVNVLHFWDTP